MHSRSITRHVRENGRLTLMFMALEGAPKIVRLYGHAVVHEPGLSSFDALYPHFTPLAGARAIVELTVTRISDACGFGVPLYEYRGERSTLLEVPARKGTTAMNDYRKLKNTRSIDDLQGLLGADDD